MQALVCSHLQLTLLKEYTIRNTNKAYHKFTPQQAIQIQHTNPPDHILQTYPPDHILQNITRMTRILHLEIETKIK